MLAWACDLIVASSDAEFCDSPRSPWASAAMNGSFIPGNSGPRKAKEFLSPPMSGSAEGGASARQWSITSSREANSPPSWMTPGAENRPQTLLRAEDDQGGRQTGRRCHGQPAAIDQAFGCISCVTRITCMNSEMIGRSRGSSSLVKSQPPAK